jgi:uncharacterized repeat protein (TIGR03803 family)
LTLIGGKLYGTTRFGGAYGDGTAFRINTDGTGYTKLADFNGSNGSDPFGRLVLSGSTLYGTTLSGGGSYGGGVVFSLAMTGGTPTPLLVFSGTNGANPECSLTLGGSTLFGTTVNGGKYGPGNIFSINTNGGGYADLYDFGASTSAIAAYGAGPQGTLALSGSTLYGTTGFGFGSADPGGTVFALSLGPFTWSNSGGGS